MNRMIGKLATRPIGPIVMGLLYFTSAELTLRLTHGADGLATVWIPSGILLATMLIVPRKMAVPYALAALLGSWVANFNAAGSIAIASGYSFANMVEALVATAILRRPAGCRVSFANPHGLKCFVMGSLIAAMVSAGIGTAVTPAGDRDFFVSWFATVWLGMLLVTPAIMVFYEATTSFRKLLIPIRATTLAQIAAAAACVAAITFFQSALPILFLPMIMAGGAVLWGGALGGIVAIGTSAIVGTWAISIGRGPVSLIDGSQDVRVLFFQGYLVIMFVAALPLARLLAAQEKMRIDLAERIRLLDQAEKAGNIGHWRVNVGDQSVYWSPEVFRIHGLDAAAMPALDEAINFYHEDDRGRIGDIVGLAIAEGRPFEFAARVVRPDGTIRHVISRGEKDFCSTDDAIGLFGIIQDITAQVETQRRLSEARDAAERAAQEAMTLADTDALTSLANRRSIMRRLAQAVGTAHETARPFSLVLFDVDHFKSVNDRFGHDMGDEVLKRVARVAAADLRATDLIGRYGGEEFILLLPDAGSAVAARIAERVRLSIEWARDRAGPPVTVSLGVATLNEGETAEQLLKRADVALYAAKESGRNRINLAA